MGNLVDSSTPGAAGRIFSLTDKALATAELPDAVRERILALKATPGWRPVLVRPQSPGGARRA